MYFLLLTFPQKLLILTIMKNHYIFFILLMFLGMSLKMSSQIPEEFPESNARWINGVYYSNGSSFNLSYTINYCLTDEDTIINEQPYAQLDTCEYGYKGAMRADADRVYFVPKDSISEYLLYDFTAQVGDTIEDVYFESYIENTASFGDVVIFYSNINEIGFTVINYDEPHEEQGYWIRNVGARSGLFRAPWPLLSEGEHRELSCFSHNDTIYHNDFESGTCALDLSILSHAEMKIKIYPNPTNDKVTCQLEKYARPDRISLVNTLGKEVEASFSNSGSELEIDLSALPDGLYILNLVIDRQVVSEKILKNSY